MEKKEKQVQTLEPRNISGQETLTEETESVESYVDEVDPELSQEILGGQNKSDLSDMYDMFPQGLIFDAGKEDDSEALLRMKDIADSLAANGYTEREGKIQETTEVTQEDIDLVRAYFVSDAYKERIVTSLGYDKLEELTPDDRKVYDEMVRRGEDMVKNIRIGDSGGESQSWLFNEDTPAISVSGRNVNQFGINHLSHEMAHAVYNTKAINPGIHNEERTYGGNEKQYGKEGSPLSTINRNEVSEERAKKVYWNYYKNMASSMGMGKNDAKMLLDWHVGNEKNKMHDNAGIERAADVHGVRLMMLKEGIWNPFSPEPVTEEKVQEFRRRHPDSRIFEYWNDKEAAYYLNNIAMQESPVKEESEQGQKLSGYIVGKADTVWNELASANFEQVSQDMSKGEENIHQHGMSV